ncbi:Gag Polyprotein [Phytophthora cinnamomi]|uniref:Gag Polyprotein n=1 Tax=Phytophthora cinnamomi TaxID=4785 RepID=UPI0035595545|nr:Gag Polyprotein [Phytophthora cinnamomi]
MTRVMGYWSNFRGSGDSNNADLGFSLWERDHWILPKAVETTFSAIAADLDMMDLDCRAEDSDEEGLGYFEGCLVEDPGFSEVTPEFMLEPTMPGYSLEYLPWEPKTVDWLSEVAALDAAEPWRNGWINVPEQHPYNTTFCPCNPSAPLFVPAGSSRADVGRRVVQSSSLQPGELSP